MGKQAGCKHRISKASGSERHRARFSLPFSVCCLHCRGFMAKYTRFNSHKETIKGHTYCGVAIYRFIIKCKICSRLCTLVTDPANATYTAEEACFRVDDTDSNREDTMCQLKKSVRYCRVRESVEDRLAIDHLQRHAKHLLNVDLKMVAEAVRLGITIQEQNRIRLLKKLEDAD